LAGDVVGTRVVAVGVVTFAQSFVSSFQPPLEKFAHDCALPCRRRSIQAECSLRTVFGFGFSVFFRALGLFFYESMVFVFLRRRP